MKLKIAVIAICAISAFTFNSGIAEPTHPNEVGIYTNDDGTGDTGGFYDLFDQFEIYLVLTRPTDVEKGSVPYQTIKGFECRLTFRPHRTIYFPLIKLIETLGSPYENAGYSSSIESYGYLDYIVELDADVPVTEESVILVAFTFMFIIGPESIQVTLGPTASPTIPGQMSFWTSGGEPQTMYSVGGSHESPVFIFNGEAVASEQMSFGQVKALYR